MAFRQPILVPPRHIPNPAPESSKTAAPQQRAIDDSQEWVLFSPSQAHYTDGTQTTSTDRTPRTAGLSRLSDFGSLNTAARSGQNEDDVFDAGEDAVEDDEELDSLDDGLHAFGEPALYHTSRRLDQSGGSILPAHDGLGTFPASSSAVQQQLWNFERYNPYKRSLKHLRRRSSAQRRLDANEDPDGQHLENERMERIEKWRMEQSKILLDEIEKETRRRKLCRSSDLDRDDAHTLAGLQQEKCESPSSNMNVPDQSRASTLPCQPEKDESFWQRITRRVIRDFMGIDESLLSVIFGESLLADTPSIPRRTLTTTPPTPLDSRLGISTSLVSHDTWEDRLLTRLARELGTFVHHLSEHPGAFSTEAHPTTMDYAGIPIDRQSTPRPIPDDPASSSSTPYFTPTLQDRPAPASATNHPELWGVDEEDRFPSQDTAYWERTPDLKAVFGYLHQRFISQRDSSTPSTKPNIAISNTPDTLHRAAVIRQHHPLVPRTTARSREHRQNSLFHHIPPSSVSLKRPGSSCASLSTKKSRRGASGSSRNYWDIGGSVGSGSAIAATGGLGAWGEV
ncbi:hypothetical protein MMC24_005097 [Lignoscripta atroalba]|nr:hypothetical protein [Lignoscripta atroalba]